MSYQSFQSPQSTAAPDPSIQGVVTGQKLILWGLLVIILTNVWMYLNTRIASFDENGVMLPLNMLIALGLVITWLGGVICAIVGVFTAARGLKTNIIVAILLCMLMFIPLLNIILLAVLNSKAVKKLKANGYTVGLMGAKARQA